MDHNEKGCQAPERPILCVNNCGFFGSQTTMNMCSKCHKEAILKDGRDTLVASPVKLNAEIVETKAVNEQVSGVSSSVSPADSKKGPTRCRTCQKRVGLTGFSCRCGNLFCSAHRYADKHECSFDYRGVALSSIAKANPVIKAAKLDKI